jgi:iron complex outermembrane recepter protein
MKRFHPLALAVLSAPLAAQQQTEMEHVLVTVPVHKQIAETALPVTVLSGDELRRAATASIGDTLANSPGLANASFGPGVGQPVIRGQAGPRVTVLQNGTRSADASNISADHAVAVEPILAESLEVLRGPATLLYGGGAIGGVVNVVDNRIPVALPEKLEAAVELRGDTANDGGTFVGRLDGAAGDFAWHADGLYRDWDNLAIPGMAAVEEQHDEEHGDEHGGEARDGTLENSDGRTKALTLGGAWHFDSGFFGLAVNRLENQYGIPPGGHGHHGEDHDEDHHDEGLAGADDELGEEEESIRIDLEQTRYDMALHVHEPAPGLDVMRGFFNYTDYEHVELEGAETGTRYSNESWEGRLEMVHSRWGKFHGSFGLQASAGEFSASGGEAFIPETDSRELGLFLIEDYHNGAWTLEGGLRLDHVERDPSLAGSSEKSFTLFSASGSALYELGDNWRLGAALMHSERAPATEELFSNVAVSDPEDWVVHAATQAIEVGEPDLDTETSNNIDLSLSWITSDHFVSLKGFFNDFSDYISLLNTGLELDETPVFFYGNADAKFYGIELDSEFTLGTPADGRLLLGVTGDLIRGELDRGGDIPRLPPARLGLKLSWEGDSWLFYARMLEAADQDRPGDNEDSTDGYTRWDAGAEYRLAHRDGGEWVVFVSLNNITDEQIRLSTSFLREVAPEAGRGVEGGVRFLF